MLEERDSVIDGVTEHQSRGMVCILTYGIGSICLNMQQRCRLIEAADSFSVLAQPLGRFR